MKVERIDNDTYKNLLEKTSSIAIAKEFLMFNQSVEKFESAKYDAVLLKNGSTQEVVKVCEKGSPTCDKKLQKFKINKPYWKIMASTCK